MLAELQRIAKLPDGDPELVAFDKGVESRVTDLRRRLAKLLDSPPGFGLRGTGGDWMRQLQLLARSSGFRKSPTLRPELARIETQRADAMAGDFADGVTPDVVKAFRTRLLALAGRDGLPANLATRMTRVYGGVMPGLGPPVADGVYFVIGPSKQLDAYQEYLHAAVARDRDAAPAVPARLLDPGQAVTVPAMSRRRRCPAVRGRTPPSRPVRAVAALAFLLSGRAQ